MTLVESELLYDQAKSALAKAISLDEADQHGQAAHAYADACHFALAGFRADASPSRRRAMVARIEQWLARAEELKTRTREFNLDAVMGLENVKQVLLQTLLLPVTQPQLFTAERKPWKSLLLFGPPGTGKTELARALASSSHCNFMLVTSSDLISKHLGESERAVRELFAQARAKSTPSSRCIVFIDEIDALGRARSEGTDEHSRRVLGELLLQMDGLAATSQNQVFVIGATNRPQDLDPALRRRFERRVLVPLPDMATRAKILAQHLGPPAQALHSLTATDVAGLAAQTDGFSGADLSLLANTVLMKPIKTCLRATHFTEWTHPGLLTPCQARTPGAIPIKLLDAAFDADKLLVPCATRQDALEALQVCRASTLPAQLKALEGFASEFATDAQPAAPSERSLALETQVNQVWRVEPSWSFNAFVKTAVSTVRNLVGV
jgi:vacuolar protein-sorting-associated protein 4